MPEATNATVKLVAIGLTAGLFSTLFGVGGGLVVVPMLLWLLRMDAKAATATSLAGICITAIAGASDHAALGNVNVVKALEIGLPATVGVLVGIALKHRISSTALVYAFSAFMLLVAARMALPGESAVHFGSVTLEALLVAALGLAAGITAGLFGIGGGLLFVPALIIVLGVGQDVATGTSLAAMIPVSLLGTWRQRHSGAVHWRAALVIGLCSAVTAVGGALLVEHTKAVVLRSIFAALVVLTAAQLSFRARRASLAAAAG